MLSSPQETPLLVVQYDLCPENYATYLDSKNQKKKKKSKNQKIKKLNQNRKIKKLKIEINLFL